MSAEPALSVDAVDDQVLAFGRALQIVGDQWSMLIVREAFLHARRFNDFREILELSDAVLSRRLRDLVDEGIFETFQYSDRPPRFEYHLTEKGRDLWRVFVAIWSWEARWTWSAGRYQPPLLHSTCGHSITPNLGCGSCGAVGVVHRHTSARRRPGTTFEQANPTRQYRRAKLRPTGDRAHLHPDLLDLLGDRWTVSVLGASLIGLRRFGDIQRELGISPFLLSERLASFVDNDVLAKKPVSDGARRFEYRPLPKAVDLMPVFAFTNEWANRWYPDQDGPALEILHTVCGEPLKPIWMCNACGEALNRNSIRYEM